MVTASGNFSDPAFRYCLVVVGFDRMFFSLYYPFEQMEDACDWFEGTWAISEAERLQIGRQNVIKDFNLGLLD